MTSSDFNGLPYEDTTFIGLLKIVGFRKLILIWPFFWSIIIVFGTIIVVSLLGSVETVFFSLASSSSGNMLGASAGALGIIIAALTVAITLFHQKLLPIMLKTQLLQKFLFPFWFAVVLWGFNVISCLIIPVFVTLNVKLVCSYLFGIELFLFSFATFYTIKLTGIVIRLALQKAQLD